MGCSSTRSLDDFGTTSCFTVSMVSMRVKVSRVLCRRDTAADPAGQTKITLPGTCKPQGWNFVDDIRVVQPRSLFNGSASFPGLSSRSEAKNKEKKEMEVAMGQRGDKHEDQVG